MIYTRSVSVSWFLLLLFLSHNAQSLLVRDPTKQSAEETLTDIQALRELASGTLPPIYERAVVTLTRMGRACVSLPGRVALCRGFAWTPTPGPTERCVTDKERKV